MNASKRIIVNADDFGYRIEINEAIIFTHKNGILPSTTVMTEREGFDHAVSLKKDNPDLRTGLHIDLDLLFMMEEPNRFFKTIAKINNTLKIRIKDAIDKQLEKFLKAGFKLTHFDGHHHCHMHPEVLPIVARKAKDYNVPIRFFSGYYDCSRFIYKDIEKNILIPILKEFNIKFPYFLNDKFDLDANYEIGEVMLHPGFQEKWRNIDMAKCCNPELKRQLKEKNIEVISFEDI